MPGNWLPFEDARNLVAACGFKNQTDFHQWKDRPDNIPSNPRSTYADEWAGWAYWLGTGPKSNRKPGKDVAFLPFEEALILARTLASEHGMKNQQDWVGWAKSEARPREMPADPSRTYRDKGWNGWPDWLGRTPTRASGKETVRPYVEARDFARSLNLKTSRDWYEWAATQARPLDVPYSPDTRYRDEGWIGWGDFLGLHSRWTHQGIVAFLDSLKPIIHTLSEFDLYLILSRNGMLRRDARLRNAKLLRGLTKLKTAEEIEKAKEEVATEAMGEETTEKDTPDKEPIDPNETDEVDVENLPALNESQLLPLHVLDDIRAVDAVSEARISNDPEILDFMVQERVAALWNQAIEDGTAAALESIPENGGPFMKEIGDRFRTELEAVLSVPVPGGYSFKDESGQQRLPNLMQRLTAYRLLTEHRLGNWSGVGAGKTISAVLSAGVLDAQLTVIVAANATLAGWFEAINQVYSEGIFVFKGRPPEFEPEPGVRNFLLVNYESFQQEWSEEFVRRLSNGQKIDFLVLDEVQFVRQRFKGAPRLRRRLLESLIAGAIKHNSELRILAMSATPVVNNLREAVKLLELIRPEQDFSEVPVGASVANAAQVHLLLRKHGIRWVPDYEGKHGLKQVRSTPTLDGERLLPRLLGVQPRDVLRLEQALLDIKIEQMDRWVRRGTLIFTYFVEGIVDRIIEKVKGCGLRAEQFTGTAKADLKAFVEKFKRNEVDVLVGSAPVGTGVDGLQYHLDRLLFLTLPWSNAEYQQIVGRLYRQGRQAGPVEIIIPQVVLREDRAGIWSWDDLRLRLIEYKRTLADAAVDGMIPAGGLPSREEMQRRSLDALHVWASNVGKGIQ